MQARAPPRARARQRPRRLAPAPVQPVEPRRLRPGPMMLFTIPIISQLETVMKHVLNFFHTNLGLPWAWAIVATTVLVRMLLVPLTIRQIHSMQSLQRHAPQMKEIQKKYKRDKQKQNEELMKFYRENNINPAASCLPMLLQLPVFIALYYTLKHFNSNFHPGRTRGPLVAPLRPEHHASTTTAFWGGYVLLVVYVASQMASTLFMAPTADKTQRMLFMVMPLVLRLRHRALPGRARPLLGDDEPVDGRAGADHAATGRADAGAGTRAAQLADAAEGRRLERQRREPRGAVSEACPVGLAAASPGAAQEEAHEPEMSELGGPDGRGDRGDGRRGEVGGAARARAAASRARQGRGAVRGRRRRRARDPRRRLRAGPRGRASAGRGRGGGGRSRACRPRRAARPARRGRSWRRSSRRSASTRTSSRATSRRRSSSRAPAPTSACSSAATARRSTRCSTSST